MAAGRPVPDVWPTAGLAAPIDERASVVVDTLETGPPPDCSGGVVAGRVGLRGGTSGGYVTGTSPGRSHRRPPGEVPVSQFLCFVVAIT